LPPVATFFFPAVFHVQGVTESPLFFPTFFTELTFRRQGNLLFSPPPPPLAMPSTSPPVPLFSCRASLIPCPWPFHFFQVRSAESPVCERVVPRSPTFFVHLWILITMAEIPNGPRSNTFPPPLWLLPATPEVDSSAEVSRGPPLFSPVHQ